VLEGLRVLDLTDESGFLAGKILGELGADVIKVEPPQGDRTARRGPFLGGIADPERSLVWLALNTGKRGIVLDLDGEEGRARYRRLLAFADVVLESGPRGAAGPDLESRGLGWEETSAEHPRLVHCVISPFGATGPWAGLRGSDLVVVALGGNQASTGDPDRPPVRCSMPTAYYHAGPEAALGVLMALHAREDSGRGQRVDVSLHETQLQTMLSYHGQYALTGKLVERSGPFMAGTREIWPAKDGMVSFGLRGGPARIPNLIATVQWMDECGMAPPWLRDYDWPSYNHNELDRAEIDRLEDAFGAFFASKTMAELYAGALERRILLAPCNDAREILAQEQLRDRELFTRIDYPELGASVEHPAFFAKFRNHPARMRRRAPRIGEHEAEVWAEIEALERGAGRSAASAPTRPHAAEAPGRRATAAASGLPRGIFEGLKVLEIGSGAAGPVATRYFAEHGARVIRIESGLRPDFLRVLWLTKDSEFGVDGSPMFVLLNANKESVTLNLKQPRAQELARELVRWADVLCENYAPGVMARFGLDYDSLRRVNPELVMASGCLFGQTGPQRSYPGFGGQGSAISGFNHLTGWPDGAAYGPAGTITDSLSPRYVAVGIAAALLRRRRQGGGGDYIDVSQIETAVYSLSEAILRYSANGEVETRRGNRCETLAPHGAYPCRGDDRWIAIAVANDAEWQRLVEHLGAPAWACDPRFADATGRLAHQDELDECLARWTRDRDRYELMDELQAAGVQAGVVQDSADLLRDPQLAHRGHWVKLSHVHLGELWFERSGIRFSGGSGSLRTPGPNLGEHTDAVLGDLLGLSAAEIARLRESGVVA
jgi:crotonobetainyl-CoA:carnitine CoA-transferase CaiB-like acyl-CoA transferase